jgi:hypothetical protein
MTALLTRILLLSVCVLMISNVAMADHIGIYSDVTGSSCVLGAGFSTTATVIHKFTTGATASRFKLTPPAGSNIFAFTSSLVTVGDIHNDLSVGYGQCFTGSIVLGQIIADWAPGVASIEAADGQPFVLFADCLFAEKSATGGRASVGFFGHFCDMAAVPSTWGSVKALYK